MKKKLEKIIIHTFNHLVKEGKGYGVYDIEGNYYESIEDFRGAVRNIVSQAIATMRGETIREVEEFKESRYFIKCEKCKKNTAICVDGFIIDIISKLKTKGGKE